MSWWVVSASCWATPASSATSASARMNRPRRGHGQGGVQGQPDHDPDPRLHRPGSADLRRRQSAGRMGQRLPRHPAGNQTPAGQLTAYGYLLDFETAPLQSSATWGARLSGSRRRRRGPSLTWDVEYARQTDYRSNPADFDPTTSPWRRPEEGQPKQVTVGPRAARRQRRARIQYAAGDAACLPGLGGRVLTTPACGEGPEPARRNHCSLRDPQAQGRRRPMTSPTPTAGWTSVASSTPRPRCR